MYIPDNYDAYISYERENERLNRYYGRVEDDDYEKEDDEGEDE